MSLLLRRSKRHLLSNRSKNPTPIAIARCNAIGAGAGVLLLLVLVHCGIGAAAMTDTEVDMTVGKEVEAEILRLFHAEKWRPTTIAKQLGIHRSVAQRVLSCSGVAQEVLRRRSSRVDAYIPFIRATLEQYPKLTAARLHDMVKQRGYSGCSSRFREVVAQMRPRPAAEAYMRTATLPGEQAQVDWAHFGRVKIGNAERRLLAFVMVLSWSRHIFLRFYTGDAMPNFLRGHVDAFEFFERAPREILYDNLRSAVLERQGSAIRFNPELLSLAAYYRFLPKPVGVRKANQKGRVERAIQYARSSFYEAREWSDLADLNRQALSWCSTTAGARTSRQESGLTVLQAFEKEKASLLMLPDNPYPAFERKEVQVGKTPYVRFDLNDYSVGHEYVRRGLTVMATPDEVLILDGVKEVARHIRCYEKGRQIEDRRHVQELEDYKEAGRKHRAIDRLRHASASAQELLKQAAERGHQLARLTQQLMRLLDLYGPCELEAAIQEALRGDSPHAAAVQQALESRRHKRGLPPPVALDFGSNRVANELVVVPKPLDIYDSLLKMEDD
jgi:transposase